MPLLPLLQALCAFLCLIGALLLQHVGGRIEVAHPCWFDRARQGLHLLAFGNVTQAQGSTPTSLGFVQGRLALHQRCGGLARTAAFALQTVFHGKTLVAIGLAAPQRCVDVLSLLVQMCPLLRSCLQGSRLCFAAARGNRLNGSRSRCRLFHRLLPRQGLCLGCSRPAQC